MVASFFEQIKNHQVIHFKWMNCMVGRLCLNKAIFKKEDKVPIISITLHWRHQAVQENKNERKEKRKRRTDREREEQRVGGSMDWKKRNKLTILTYDQLLELIVKINKAAEYKFSIQYSMAFLCTINNTWEIQGFFHYNAPQKLKANKKYAKYLLQIMKFYERH